jgi:hypothetical protein
MCVLSTCSVHNLEANSPLQPGFKKFHSTESLITSLLAGIFVAFERRQIMLLARYDVSAAFYTVDHSIFLERLEKSFVITDIAILWLQSSLSDRSHSVVFGSSIAIGLPRGSALFYCFTCCSILYKPIPPYI